MSETMRIELTQGKTALIDVADFTIVSAFKWRASWSPIGRTHYATASTKRADGRLTTLYMHRLITGAPKGKEVDHINHDTLDNRRSNLRVGSHKDNMQNCRFAKATHCPRGHAYDEANTYVNAKGKRICRACNALRVAAVYAAETPQQSEHRRARSKAYYLLHRARIRAQQNATRKGR